MTTETTAMIEVTDDLNAFTQNFFGSGEAKVEETPAAEPEVKAEEPAETTETAEETATEQTEEEKQAEQAKKDEKSANRFTKQTRELRETQRQLRELKEQLAALQASKPEPLTEVKETATNTTLSAPDPAKYQYGELDPQFIRDTARYEAKLEAEAIKAELRKEQEEQQRATAARREAETLQTKAAEIEQAGTTAFEDFYERVVEGGQNGDYALTKEMFETVAELPKDVAAKVLYHLAANPEESAQVAQMSPRQQALWFGRMEAKLTAPPAPAPRKATAAPPPPTAATRGAGSKAGANLYDLDDPRALDAMKRALFG